MNFKQQITFLLALSSLAICFAQVNIYFIIFFNKTKYDSENCLKDTSDCGTKYGCLRNPDDCVNDNCKYLAKWKPGNGYVDFLLYSNNASFNTWMAIGFSNLQLMVRLKLYFTC